jgi:alginate O-acetyltransferase complex protein AlgI
MLFNSLEFIIYFPIVVALYFAITPRYRWILLLIASYYFYMCWNYKYIILIITSTLIDYFAGIHIYKTKTQWKKRIFLLLSLISNFGLLFSFKYFNFFGDTLNFVFDKFNLFYHLPELNVLLPVGISFYTFQTLSYTIDVYRGEKEPERHFGFFALYVSFFPQLVAGPIERSTRLLPQMRQHFKFDYERVKNGILQMCWGFFKKVVIADRLAEYVNMVYNNTGSYDGIHYIIATVFFAFQIYCDFSGYSDIAIGTASIMGFDLMRNFRRPYLAHNISEFWKRWHISLSTWFRDYLYIPLGGNRVVKWRWYYNLFITFLISGLWHGADWTFIIWGALHGFYLVSAIWTLNIRQKFNNAIYGRNQSLNNFVQIIITVFLAWFAWIFFRANNIGNAFHIINKIFTQLFAQPLEFYLHIAGIAILGIALIGLNKLAERVKLTDKSKNLVKAGKWLLCLPAAYFIINACVIYLKSTSIPINLFKFKSDLYIAIITIVLLIIIEILEERIQLHNKLKYFAKPVKWMMLILILLSIVVLGKWESIDFLYFQF